MRRRASRRTRGEGLAIREPHHTATTSSTSLQPPPPMSVSMMSLTGACAGGGAAEARTEATSVVSIILPLIHPALLPISEAKPKRGQSPYYT